MWFLSLKNSSLPHRVMLSCFNKSFWHFVEKRKFMTKIQEVSALKSFWQILPILSPPRHLITAERAATAHWAVRWGFFWEWWNFSQWRIRVRYKHFAFFHWSSSQQGKRTTLERKQSVHTLYDDQWQGTMTWRLKIWIWSVDMNYL